MTFKDIVVCPPCNSNGINIELEFIIDTYFQKIESDYDSKTLEEKIDKKLSLIQNRLKEKIVINNEIALMLSERFELKFGNSFFNRFTENGVRIFGKLFSDYWLIDENNNLTKGVQTDWQLDLYSKMAEVKLEKILDVQIKKYTDFGDNRDTYKDIESTIKHKQELEDLKSQMEQDLIKYPQAINQKEKLIHLIDVELSYLKSFVENKKILESIKKPAEQEDFDEILKDFENFNTLDYSLKLALIDKYQIECLITNINFEKQRLDKHCAVSSGQYWKIMRSKNPHDFNLYLFSPKNEKEYLQLLSWLIKRDDLYFKPFETIKNEFLEKYNKANNKEQVFNDYKSHYDLRIKFETSLSYNHIDNQVYRRFYDFGANDFNYGNKALEGLKELLFSISEGLLYADKGTLNISKIIEYCCVYFNGMTETNFLYFLKNEKESLGKVIAPPATEQRGFDLGLTEQQLKKLHQQLIDDNFIKCTDTDFINAFSGRQVVNKLEWIDKAERVKYVSIQTLFQLLHSCNIELSDKNKVIKKEVKEALNSIFSNSWGNTTSKFNGFNPLTTNRQKTISSMINNLKS